MSSVRQVTYRGGAEYALQEDLREIRLIAVIRKR
jgi:hypothetical protein